MISVAMMLLQDARLRYRAIRRDENGASVLEWALIAAAVVVAASIVGAAVFRVVEGRADDLEECGGVGAGVEC